MHLDFELFATNPDGSRSRIKQEEVVTSKKTLGIYYAPSGGNHGHLEYIHGKLTTQDEKWSPPSSYGLDCLQTPIMVRSLLWSWHDDK